MPEAAGADRHPAKPQGAATPPMNRRRLLGVWCLMLLASIGNGTLRDFTYGRRMSELAAHQLSTVFSVVLLGLIMGLALRRWPARSSTEAWRIGLFWMGLTVAFEFLFFHYLGGHSWAELLANYDVLGGRVWVLVLLWLVVAPVFLHRLACGRAAKIESISKR